MTEHTHIERKKEEVGRQADRQTDRRSMITRSWINIIAIVHSTCSAIENTLHNVNIYIYIYPLVLERKICIADSHVSISSVQNANLYRFPGRAWERGCRGAY